MPKVFSVITIKDRNLSTIIDGIRVLASPNEKHLAHITIRGPYDQRYHTNDKTIANTKVEIVGADCFFSTSDSSFKQNTVFLKCHSEKLKSVWKKSDYPFNPHLTIYDGNDREFAERILEILSRNVKSLRFWVSGIDTIKSYSKQSNTLLSTDVNYNLLSYYLKEDVSFEKIQSLSLKERLKRIETLSMYFKNWDENIAYPSPINKLLEKLNINRANGLFYFSDFDQWKTVFPYRIIRALKELKPYAFYSTFKSNSFENSNQPKPFNQPLILFFDNPSSEEEYRIHKQSFSFGQAAVLIIDRINSIDIFNGLSFDNHNDGQRLLRIGSEKDILDFSFKNLLTGTTWDKYYNKSFSKRLKVDDYLLDNLSQARQILIQEYHISPSITNRLIGRLLFTRYLIDRDVEFKNGKIEYFSRGVNNDRKASFLDDLAIPEKIYSFFHFLQDRLGGDLFVVTPEEENVITEKELEVLVHLFSGAKLFKDNNKLVTQHSLFHIYDFKIIPIELISNIYEQFIGDSKRQANKSFYTPSFLVDYILSRTVSPFLNNIGKISCRVLDPSCGSGIFLIETLRKIIEAHLIDNSGFIEAKDISTLWRIVKENIFGIDIDPDAIEVAIFSLYVTILDYIEPKVIQNEFEFQPLKNTNFFPEADFFDTKHQYNTTLKNVEFDFILGNPPWGQVKQSKYYEYCQIREAFENNTLDKKKVKLKIGISDKQIAQAFIIRASDFCSKNTQCALVVTSKVLYNTKAKNWREYFLHNFLLTEVFELSAVNTKIFNGAEWPSAILFYRYLDNKDRKEFTYNNVIHHISLKPNKFFYYFKTVVIEKYDYKAIAQRYFMESMGGDDWLWKVLLYSNFLDYHFLKRLKESFPTIFDVIKDNKLEFGVGLKRKDGNITKDASCLIGKPFLDTSKKELHRYVALPSSKWHEPTAAAIPHVVDRNSYPILFKGPLVLLKEGLDTGYKGVAAFYPKDIIFTHSVRSIKGTKAKQNILKGIVALFNSRLFTYFIFQTGTSTGIDFVRANQIEQFAFPAVIDMRLSEYVDKIFEVEKSNKLSFLSEVQSTANTEYELNRLIFELYGLSDEEIDLVDYIEEVSIPQGFVSKLQATFRPLKKSKSDQKVLVDYVNVIVSDFSIRLNSIDKKLVADIFYDADIVCVNFIVVDLKSNRSTSIYNDNEDVFAKLKPLLEISFSEIAKELYLQRDIKGFQKDSFYIIKPNEYKNWHRAIARLDLLEFYDAIFKSQKTL